MSSVSAPAKWLADELAALLSSPHAPAPDLFNTRFNTIFMRHARGLIGGREVDREGLKQGLLALQKNWDAAQQPKYADTTLHHRIDGFHPEMGVQIEFMSPLSCIDHVITCEACVAKQGGGRRIKMLMLEGDPALFRP